MLSHEPRAFCGIAQYEGSPTYGPWEQATAAYLLRIIYMRYLYVESVCKSLCIYRIYIIRSRYFYPSIFDDEGLASPTTNGSTAIVDHFISYVLGAAGKA